MYLYNFSSMPASNPTELLNTRGKSKKISVNVKPSENQRSIESISETAHILLDVEHIVEHSVTSILMRKDIVCKLMTF